MKTEELGFRSNLKCCTTAHEKIRGQYGAFKLNKIEKENKYGIKEKVA